MGIFPHVQWGGIGFAPFSSPESPQGLGQEYPGSFFTEWATGATPDESRRSPRLPIRCELLMTEPGWWETENPLPIRGECRNLSEDGLYAVVPSGYRLAVGQSYHFQLRSIDGQGQDVAHEGTIVRTETFLGYSDDRVGIGVRLSEALS